MLESALRPYKKVLGERSLSPFFGGLALVFVGEGMSTVSIPWLALKIADPGQAGLWTGLSLAAYTLPGVVGGFAFAPLLRGRPAALTAQYAFALRAAGLLAAVVLAATGRLTSPIFVVVLAGSAVLGTWGTSAQYTIVANVLPPEGKLAGNALIASLSNLGIIIGAAVAGFLADVIGPQLNLLIHAITLILLVVICRRLARSVGGEAVPPDRSRVSEAGVRILLRNRPLSLMIAMTVVYYLLAGPIQAALPVFVAQDLHASSTLLGTVWAFSGVGAVIGGLVFGMLRNPPVGITVVLVMLGTSSTALLLGSTSSSLLVVVFFSLGRLAFAPFPPLSVTMIQEATPASDLAEVLAARGSLIMIAPPVGQAVGGALISLVGARESILLSGSSTLALGLLILLLLGLRPGFGGGKALH